MELSDEDPRAFEAFGTFDVHEATELRISKGGLMGWNSVFGDRVTKGFKHPRGHTREHRGDAVSTQTLPT